MVGFVRSIEDGERVALRQSAGSFGSPQAFLLSLRPVCHGVNRTGPSRTQHLDFSRSRNAKNRDGLLAPPNDFKQKQ